MYCLTDFKNNRRISEHFFPVGKIGNTIWYIEEKPYEEYASLIDSLINQFSENDNDKAYLFDCVEQKKLPRGKSKLIVSAMINTLDEYCKRVVEVPKNIVFKIPNPVTRDAINVYGISGSGKSYWTAQYVKQIREIMPDRDIFLVTTNTENDPIYKGLGIKKLDVSDRNTLGDYEFTESSFEDSLVIFDDIESHDEGIYQWIRNLRDMLFLKSRKHHTDIINIIHKGLDYYNSRIPNSEANGCVVFPRHSWSEAKKILSNYFELTNKQITTVHGKRKSSRWVYVHKLFPKYIIWSNGIQILD